MFSAGRAQTTESKFPEMSWDLLNLNYTSHSSGALVAENLENE